MANMKKNRGNHLADNVAKLKQSQPLMETPMTLVKAIKDSKYNIMEAQHLAPQQKRKKWFEQS